MFMLSRLKRGDLNEDLELDDGAAYLHITWPFGQTVGLALLIFTGVFIMGEAWARRFHNQHRYRPPSIGSSHRQFEVKIALMDNIVRREGTIDCVVLGNSSVMRAIDPQAVQASFEETNDEPMQCFNFGLQALNPWTASQVAELLVSKYQPGILIYGVDLLAFDETSGLDAEEGILSTPWVQYHLNDFSIDGWMVEHSYALRYYLLVRNWMLKDFFSEILPDTDWGANIDNYGYREKTREGVDVTRPVDVDDRPLFDRIKEHDLAYKHIDGFIQLMELDARTNLFFFEVPIHDSLMQFFDGEQEQYLDEMGQLQNLAEKRGIPFWRVWDDLEIPDEAWLNRNHLNHDGAQLFSRWIGARLGDEVALGMSIRH
jgi:hypothetical protein